MAICPEKQPLQSQVQSHTLTHFRETNMHVSYTHQMYSKYSLFYESPKNWRYYVHAQTVCTRPLLGGEGPGDEAIACITHGVQVQQQDCAQFWKTIVTLAKFSIKLLTIGIYFSFITVLAMSSLGTHCTSQFSCSYVWRARNPSAGCFHVVE